MKNVAPQKLFFYTSLFAFFSLLFLISQHISEHRKLLHLEQRLTKMQESFALNGDKYAKNVSEQARYCNNALNYVENYLEPLDLLLNEQKELQKIIKHAPLSSETGKARERLNALKNAKNQISFLENGKQLSPLFKESVEKMKNPIEIDEDDLNRILSYIENVRIDNHSSPANPPQLIITDFRLKRKRANNTNETFILTMSLLKREFFTNHE